MTKRHILLAATALVAASAAANAQDVVMRRPLTSAGSGATGTGTPTPTTTPTPTPTTTPPDGGTDPVITNPNGDRASGYGWYVDCTALPPTCFQIDADTYNETAVDPSQCPATQSTASDTLAHDFGYLGMAEAGTQHGAQFCGGKDPAGNTSVYVAFQNCNGADANNGITGTVGISCLREIFQSPIATGSYPTVAILTDPTTCETQAKNQDWITATANAGSALDPATIAAKMANDGKSCTGDVQATAYGMSCGQDTCTTVVYDDNPYDPGVTYASYQTSLSACQNAQTVSAVGQKILAQMGLVPGGTGISATCSSPDVYGAKGTCVQSVTYDPGWPQSGQSHVTSGFQPQCFAVYNAADPNTLTLSQVSVSDCENQHPTAAQEAILQTLAPDLQDYATLPKTCDYGASNNTSYQRVGYDNAQDDATPTVPYSGSYNNPDPYVTENRTVLASGYYLQWQDDYYVPYVCTDAAPGSYFSPSNQGLYSEFPMNTGTCGTAHDADIQAIQNYVQANPTSNSIIGYYTSYDFNQGQCAGGGCGISFTDQEDKQRFKITVIYARDYANGNAGCAGPACGDL